MSMLNGNEGVPPTVSEQIAAEAGHNDKPFVYVLGGEQFLLPAHIDPRIVAAAQLGEIGITIKLIFRSEYKRFLEVDASFDKDDLQRLLRAWAEWTGTSMGESSASTS